MKPPKRKRVPTRFIPDCSDCVREQRKRVSETFEATACGNRAGELYLGVSFPRLTDKRFKPKDRVRVKVTKLERGK